MVTLVTEDLPPKKEPPVIRPFTIWQYMAMLGRGVNTFVELNDKSGTAYTGWLWDVESIADDMELGPHYWSDYELIYNIT